MKVLVTGAAGFIGSHTAEKLKSMGFDVLGVDNFNSYYNPVVKRTTARELLSRSIEVKEGDLRDHAFYETLDDDFEAVLHLAAQPGIAEKSTFEDYVSNNIIATYNMLQFATRLTHLKLFVNVATSSIYGREACYPENHPAAPISNYGVTKLAAEQLVLAKSRENILKACSLRLYSVYGPRERPDKLAPKLIDAAFSQKPFSLYQNSENHLRSYTYIDDAVNGIVSVLGKELQIDGEIINIGTDVQQTTRQFMETVEKLTGKKIPVEITPKRKGDQLRTAAIIDKARKLLGYNPKITLEEGLSKHIEWYLNQKK